MARPFKSGVDYFPLDVVPDDKIELLEAEHGITGFGIWVKLLQKIYANNYWIKWNNKSVIIFSNRVNVNKNEVNVIINSCIEWGIFDGGMLEKHEILTSRGIQKRFFEIVKRRKGTEIILDYLLVDCPDLEEMKIINVDNNPVNDDKSTQRKGKETKDKEILIEKAFEKWWPTYPERNGKRIGKKETKKLFTKLKQDQWKDLKTATDNYISYLNESGISARDAKRFLSADYWKEFIKSAEPSQQGNQSSTDQTNAILDRMKKKTEEEQNN